MKFFDLLYGITKQWLRFLGCFREPVPESTAFSELIDDFTTWMTHERGLAPSTIRVWSSYVKQFLIWYEDQKRPIEAIDISDVDSFLASRGRKDWCRVTVANRAVSLRAFFRYAEIRG